MKKRSTYRLLIQSEERNKNMMEIAVYVLVALMWLIPDRRIEDKVTA